MSLATAAAILLLCALAYVITLRNLGSETDRTLVREASAYAAAVRSAPASEALAAATRTYLQGRTGGQSGASPILLLVFDGGRKISNSDIAIYSAADNHVLTSPPTAPAFAYAKLDGTTYRTLSVPVEAADGSRIGTFQVALSADTARNIAVGVVSALGAAGILVVVLASALSIWAAREALRPLHLMAADASAISVASPGMRLDYKGPPDELGALASALNAMLGRLEHAYAEQRKFVANASHELRTPVSIVRGNVELLHSGRIGGVDALESLEMIDAESARMTRLLDELLSLARLEGAARPFQPLEVRTMLEEGAARVNMLGPRTITVDAVAGLWVSGDPDLLDQALLNVLKNAFSHTSEGGHITLSANADDLHVRLMIADDGPGIPEPELERIFDRFYRAQGPRPQDSGGAGLGLAIARRLVDLHSGTIRAENVSGTGARFTIELPRITAPGDRSVTAKSAPAVSPAALGRRRRVW